MNSRSFIYNAIIITAIVTVIIIVLILLLMYVEPLDFLSIILVPLLIPGSLLLFITGYGESMNFHNIVLKDLIIILVSNAISCFIICAVLLCLRNYYKNKSKPTRR